MIVIYAESSTNIIVNVRHVLLYEYAVRAIRKKN
jgi:hypothetical protein